MAQIQFALIGAGTTLVAVIASFVTVDVLCRWCGADTTPAILAALLAIALSRRGRSADRIPAVAMAFAIAFIALAAAAVGWLLRAIPELGAPVFAAGMWVSVWLRNFGERSRTIGVLIAMPLVGMLAVPLPSGAAPGGPVVDIVLVVCAGVVAFIYVTGLRWLAHGAGVQPLIAERAGNQTSADHPQTNEERPRIKLSPASRMALQMAVALCAAFAVGFTVFPAHWSWTALTAFIVCRGARGRGDAAHTGILRLAGAMAGTFGAVFAHMWSPNGVAEAAVIFAVLFLGLLLRDVNYAYWACCMTLILALLVSGSSPLDLAMLCVRLESILAGALCAVASAWFVFPIRTEAVVRRRLADMLRALDDVVAHAHRSHDERTMRLVSFDYRLAELERVAPAVIWHRRIFASGKVPEHPANWIDIARGFRDHAHAFGPRAAIAKSSAPPSTAQSALRVARSQAMEAATSPPPTRCR